MLWKIRTKSSRISTAFKKKIEKTFHTLGYDIVRHKNIPKYTLLGMTARRIRTVIDCGANEGQFAHYISGFFPGAALYCFEPLEGPFQTLLAWAATQNGRVQCFNVALGEQEGTAIMHNHMEHSPSSSLLPTTGHAVKLLPQTVRQLEVVVPLTTLDTALRDVLDGMAPEILLKLDVQGYEDRVLRGAELILEKVHACLLEVCVDPLYDKQANFKELVSLLDRHGVRYAGNLDQSYAEDGRVMWFDALFLRR